jgi:SIR2-like domain
MSASSLDPAGAEDLAEHCRTVVVNMLKGRVTPVLGAGASLYGRPAPAATGADPAAGEAGAPDSTAPPWAGPPSAGELADRLAEEFMISSPSRDLLQIAQWVYALGGGAASLYETLHEIFDRDFPPTALHDFLADVPGRLRKADRGRPPLIVTTNYDDLMERALDARDEAYDVVVYMAEKPHEGVFCHVDPDGELVPITSPSDYLAVDPERRTVILKMHGFVSRVDPNSDSYVITEDHYIEYLTRTDLTKLLPKPVVTHLLNCHLLFLGYSLRDWNLRAILYQIKRDSLLERDWWAVQLNPDRLERRSWAKRDVEIIPAELEHYIPALKATFDNALDRQPTHRQ